MPWMRLDCSTLEDEFVIGLTGDECKAWMFFLLRTKAMGARGRVKKVATAALARLWNTPQGAVESMLRKAMCYLNPDTGEHKPKIKDGDGYWLVVNWSRYQDDYRGKGKGFEGQESTSAEVSVDAEKTPTPPTPPHVYPTDTPQEEKDLVVDAPRRERVNNSKQIEELEFVLRLHDNEFSAWVQAVHLEINHENEDRRSNPFAWKPQTGSFESDMKGLIYRVGDEEKKRILWDAYNILGEKLNWPNYVMLAIRYTARASRRTRIVQPYGFTFKLLYRPGEIVSAKTDGMLSGIQSAFRTNQ